MTLDLDQARKIATRLAEGQAKLAMDRWSSVGALAYKDRRDFRSEVDVEIERNLKDGLRERFPDHGLFGEETARENADAEFQWLIDPIDGTKYYAAQSMLFSISLGLLQRGHPVLGVVHLPVSGQCFHACKGGGAFVDGRRLSGSRVEGISNVILNLDTPGSDQLDQSERAWFERKMTVLHREVYRVRAIGVGSLAACWLAGGAFDAHVDLTGRHEPTDLAAGRVIMEESGAKVGFVDVGAGPPRLVGAPPAIWETLRRILQE